MATSCLPLQHSLCWLSVERVSALEGHEQIPLAVHVVEKLRPRVVVELGTRRGDFYCALCQAVDALGLPARCYGFHGDAGGAGAENLETMAEFRAYHDGRYGRFSELLRGDFEEALHPFAAGSIDLLHIARIEHGGTPGAVASLFDPWRSRLSARGVVLVSNLLGEATASDALWAEERTKYPYFELRSGRGLGLLAVGADAAAALAELLEVSSAERKAWHTFFSRLGARQQQAAALSIRAKELNALMLHDQGRLQGCMTQLGNQTEQLRLLQLHHRQLESHHRQLEQHHEWLKLQGERARIHFGQWRYRVADGAHRLTARVPGLLPAVKAGGRTLERLRRRQAGAAGPSASAAVAIQEPVRHDPSGGVCDAATLAGRRVEAMPATAGAVSLEELRAAYLNVMKKSLTGTLNCGGVLHSVVPHASGDTSEVCLVSGQDGRQRSEGRDWPAFAPTMIGMQRLSNLQFCIEDVLERGVPGDLIETGVWRGGAAIFMRAVLQAFQASGRNVWVADSFEGLPAPNEADYPADAGMQLHTVDFLAVSLEEVKDNFARYGLLDDQVRFLKGWFRDTLPTVAGNPWAVVRLDGDLYESTMDGLTNLYPGLSPGGYLIVDDYGCLAPCRHAVEEFRERQGIREEIQAIDWSGIYWQKRL